MDRYEDGAEATEAYLAVADRRAETLLDFEAVASIRSFLTEDRAWDDLGVPGWSAARRASLKNLCDEILQRDEWVPRIHAGLESSDRGEYWQAEQAAKQRGIDVFPAQVRHIQENPYCNDWFGAWQNATPERAELLVRLARELLPLRAIATGPTQELGLGPDWRAHAALDWSLQALRDHVGLGPDLVLVGLQSPVTRNRNMSLHILKEWPPGQWPAGTAQLVNQLAATDPDQRARSFAGEVLARTAPHD
jgi:hypothetical protein